METTVEHSNDTILESIKKAVLEVEPEAKVMLFGSRARGDYREDSDWDVLIVVPNDVGIKGEEKFIHRLFEVELKFEQAISAFIFARKEWEGRQTITPFYQNIQQEGIAL